MDFLANRAEQLTAHLRKAITCGELPSSLPSLREWSAMLSVSTSTLQAALAILKREGLLASRPRSGYYLLDKRPRHTGQPSLLVRWIWQDPKHRGQPPAAEILSNLGQKLAAQGVGLRVERCDGPRLQAISRASGLPNELIIFSSLSSAQQRLFSNSRNALLIGLPHASTPLPYISSDIFPAIRHALHHLWRNGCRQVDFFNIVGRRLTETIGRLETAFHTFRTEAPQPIPGRVHWIPSDPQEQVLAIRKIIPHLASPHGIIINAPLPPALIMMILSYYGVRIPEQVQILPINILPGQNTLFPPLACYPYPVEKICASISRAAHHYFQTGKLPPLEQKIALSLIQPEITFPKAALDHLR